MMCVPDICGSFRGRKRENRTFLGMNLWMRNFSIVRLRGAASVALPACEWGFRSAKAGDPLGEGSPALLIAEPSLVLAASCKMLLHGVDQTRP